MDATLMFSAPATPPPASSRNASSTVGGLGQAIKGTEMANEPSPAQNTPHGRIFAGLMRGLLPTHERQDVAAAPETASTEPGDLKTEVLGAQINVITTSNAQPDPNSLTAFARAQGLDEAAVKALFGDMAAQAQASAETASVSLEAARLAGQWSVDSALQVSELKTAQTDAVIAAANVATNATATATAAADVAWSAIQWSAETALQVTEGKTAQTVAAAAAADVAWLAHQLSAEIAIQVSEFKSTPSAAATASLVAAALPAAPVNADATVSSVMGWNMMANGQALVTPSISVSTDPATDGMPLSVVPPSVTLPIGSGWGGTLAPSLSSPAAPLVPSGVMGPLVPTAPATGTPAVVSQPALNAPVAATEALIPLAPTAARPEDALRIRLVPAWSMVTQQLTQMSGTAMTSAWGALTATTLGAPIRSVALDLSTPLASDSTERGDLSGLDSGWGTQGTELNRPSAAATPLPGAAPAPGLAQTLRQEHYQQLADRLGQAMAERLQSQIARGEWKLQMRLNPANLGRIDVELDMHAKGLDAMFRSENPLTRELMVQSMPKLKDTLSQSGMAVASVWVNSDAGRQSDGNPTPQRDRRDVIDTPTSAPVEIGTEPATKVKRNPDGFDVLA